MSRCCSREVHTARESWGYKKKKVPRDFPDGPVVKKPPANVGDVGSIPGPEQLSPGVTNYWACTPQQEATRARSSYTVMKRRVAPENIHTQQQRPSAAMKKERKKNS